MKLSKIVVYQACEVPSKNRNNFNTINQDVIPGVVMELESTWVRISHLGWDTAVIVPLANIRYIFVDDIKIKEEIKVKPKSVRLKK
jgi:hypothetical protein